MKSQKTIGLVLGGGAARGYAHIGAIQAIQEAGLEPDAIVGSSMGGVFGALLAHGMTPAEMLDLAKTPSRFRIPGLGRRGGLLRVRALIDSYCDCLPDRFDDLDIPLCLTAVDVEQGTLVVMESGPLRMALEATSALPGLCSPVRRDDRYLVDGGLLSNLPVDLIGGRSRSPVVAIDVGIGAGRRLPFAEDQTWWKKLATRLSKRSLTAELLTRAVEIPQAQLTAAAIEAHPPDLHIVVEFPDDFRLEHFHRADEAFEYGYESARKALADSFGSDSRNH